MLGSKGLIQFHRIGVIQNHITSCAIIDHLTHKNLLKSTTNNDFGGKTLIKFYFNDCFKFYLSGSDFSDHSIQVEDNTNSPL